MKIPFNKPYLAGHELEYIRDAFDRGQISGNGWYTKKCQEWLESATGCAKALLTHSCTAALEMAALLADIQPGDEVIAPSYTFVSTANAFVLRGAKMVFVDIRNDTLNIDETLVEAAITPKTRAIVAVHYAGVVCEMDTIMQLAKKYGLIVVEDAAQALTSTYKGRQAGSIGHFGCYSFHETKNYSCGEGGALIVNSPEYVMRAEIIWEKGTNRSQYFRGMVDKYSWVDIGSSYLPGELSAAALLAQLECVDRIYASRHKSWERYFSGLTGLVQRGLIELPQVPVECLHNAHMFYIKVANIEERQKLIEHLKSRGIHSVFHYVPLHNSKAGVKYGAFIGEDVNTTRNSERILRLPLYYDLLKDDIKMVINGVESYFSEE